MGGSWFARWLAAAGGGARRLHSFRVPRLQRAHLAALLIAIALPLAGQEQSDIRFDPNITQEQFRTFSRIVGQGIYHTPVQPARGSGLLAFDVGIAATAVEVDTNSDYWQRATADDFSTSGYVALPRLVAVKGFSLFSVSASYTKLADTGITVYGGALDIPIIRGSAVSPELAVRGSYATLTGVDNFDLKVYGAELFLSKGFGPVMPYVAAGRMRSDATGTIIPAPTVPPIPQPVITMTDQSDIDRFTIGVRLNLFVPKIVIEATQGEVRSYAAKVSIGL